ncbi:hypothetical protein SOPP22_14135 [Shewanella sp. OPT22]|nr:hypothetical protein SOPP22_14135 [Shewanella sp. OPT22]
MRMHEYYVKGYGRYFDNEKVLYSENSQFQSIKVLQNPYFGKVLVLDNIVQLTEKDHFAYHEMITVVPYVLHGNVKNVLVIGGGDGGVVAELSKLGVSDITLVDIDSSVYKTVTRFMPDVIEGINLSNVKMLNCCGASFLSNTTQKYDLIIIDSTDSTQFTKLSAPLFDSAFYKNIQASLTANGIVVAQGNTCELNDSVHNRFKQARQAFDNSITYYRTYVPSYGGEMLFALMFNDKSNYTKQMRKEHVRTTLESFDADYKYLNADVFTSSFSHPQIVIEAFGESYQQIKFS